MNKYLITFNWSTKKESGNQDLFINTQLNLATQDGIEELRTIIMESGEYNSVVFLMFRRLEG